MVDIYKKGQGIYARWLAAAVVGALALFGCFELEEWLTAHTDNPPVLGKVPLSVVVSVLVFVAAAVFAGMLVNSKKFVDYLIASELELRKVSWPTRLELKRQTIVVIVTLIFLATVLFVADVAFVYGSKLIYQF